MSRGFIKIVTLPDDGGQILVRASEYAVLLDYRPHPSASWQPIRHLDGFEVEDRSA